MSGARAMRSAEAPRDLVVIRASFLQGATGVVRADQPPEPPLGQERDAVPLLAQPLDLHQLQPGVLPRSLLRVRPAADDDGRARRGTAVHDRARALRRPRRIRPFGGQDAGKGEMNALQRAEDARVQRRRRPGERVDQLVGALVALPPLADAAIDDLLQVIAAREGADLGRPDPRARVPLDQHAEQLPHLVDVVSRLPFRRGAIEDVARRRHRVHRPRGDAAAIALLPDDAEVAELEAAAVADEDVERGQIAVKQLTAVQLAEDLENAGDLAADDRLGPARGSALEVGAQVAVRGVLERERVDHGSVGSMNREPIEDPDRAGMLVEELPEVRLAQPAVDVRADLDADGLGDDRRAAVAPGQVDLAESALADQPLDPVVEAGFRADDDL